MLRAALLGAAACGGGNGGNTVSVPYGIPPTFACEGEAPGVVCPCSGNELCACTDAGTCEPRAVLGLDAGTDGG